MSLLFLLSATTIYAQINLRPGYIITNLNDTVQGQIDFRTDERNTTVCDFYPAGSSQKESYKPGDIYAYRFTDDGKFYVTRKVTIDDSPQTVFLEYLIKGVVSLYYYRGETDRFFFENEEGQMVEAIENIQKIDTQSGHDVIRTNKQYVGVMTWMFQNSDKVKKQLPKVDLTKSDLIKITKEYHYETCETGEQCIEFENKRDRRYVKFAFNVAAGIRVHRLDVDGYIYNSWEMTPILQKASSPVITIGTNISVPRLGPTFSLQIEADLSKVDGESRYKLNSNGYPHITFSSLITDLRIGGRVKLFEGKVYPFIEGGLTYSRIWNTDGTIIPYSKNAPEGIREVRLNITKGYFGVYATAGLVIELKKHSFILQGLFQYRTQMEDKLNTYGGSVGFTF